jgi:hypothetical protein
MTARERSGPLVLMGAAGSSAGDDLASYGAVLTDGQRLLAAELSRRLAALGAATLTVTSQADRSMTPGEPSAKRSVSSFHWGRWFALEADTALKAAGGASENLAAVGWAGPGALALISDEALRTLLAPDPGEMVANNRFSADAFVVAADGAADGAADAGRERGSGALRRALDGLAACPVDNAAARFLENAGFRIRDLADQPWSRFDVDTPLDLALLSLAMSLPAGRRPDQTVGEFLARARLPGDRSLNVPHIEELGAVMRNRRAQLVVAGRVPGRSVQFLETETACRVRWFVEERGMRSARGDRPRSLLGRWIEERGAASLISELATLGDAVILDSRVLMASIAGSAQAERWPAAEERFASDFGDAGRIGTPWLRELDDAASASRVPFLLGGHTLVSDGLQLLVEVAWAGR